MSTILRSLKSRFLDRGKMDKNKKPLTSPSKSSRDQGKIGETKLEIDDDAVVYSWTTPVLRLALELQCFCVALIVMTQVWILMYYGSDVFQKVVGDEIALPILYLCAIIIGTLAYAQPTYWRIVICLTAYSVCIYLAGLVTNIAIKFLTSPDVAMILQEKPLLSDPEGTSVWIPWGIGFALHMQFSLASFFIWCICLRDIYSFKPILFPVAPNPSTGTSFIAVNACTSINGTGGNNTVGNVGTATPDHPATGQTPPTRFFVRAPAPRPGVSIINGMPDGNNNDSAEMEIIEDVIWGNHIRDGGNFPAYPSWPRLQRPSSPYSFANGSFYI